MPDLTPNHPAVEAANLGVQEWLAGDGPFEDDPVRLAHDMTAACITAAIPHLTADGLRDTPAGRALKAEAWDQGYRAGEDDARMLREAEECHHNPYRGGDA